MTICLKPEQQRIIEDHIASGRYLSIDEVLDTALSRLPGAEAEAGPGIELTGDKSRHAAIQRMMSFGERHQLDPGEPISRQQLHEGHRT